MIETAAFILTLLPIFLLILNVACLNWGSLSIFIKTANYTFIAGIFTAFLFLIYSFQQTQVPIHTLRGIFRFETLSVSMFIMVGIIGNIVLRFSRSYLSGETKYRHFIQKLVFTITFVQLLVLSGNLFLLFFFWVATSLSLQSLIIHYKDRKEAIRAGKKKFILARLSDLLLLIACILLFTVIGSSELEIIFQELKTRSSTAHSIQIEIACLLLVLAAILKSVQIPFHGWLLDVLEAPTPVSALLHAGLLNAGPFLIIRFAYLFESVTLAPVFLMIIGGLSALFGAITFPAQPSVKTSLAYSSIGHMGFSLMLCGMGLYAASLLHLMAHSFYKAHSFLSSGSAVDKHRISHLESKELSRVSIQTFFISTLLSFIYFFLLYKVFNEENPITFQGILLGGIIIPGVSSFTARMLSNVFNATQLLIANLLSGSIICLFVIAESSAINILGNQIPSFESPDILSKCVAFILLFLFVAIIFYSTCKEEPSSAFSNKWQIYKRNGFYVHTIFDRFLYSFFIKN